MRPPLLTDAHRAGAAAAGLLDEAARPAEHEHRRIVFTPELVVRASSPGPMNA